MVQGKNSTGKLGTWKIWYEEKLVQKIWVQGNNGTGKKGNRKIGT